MQAYGALFARVYNQKWASFTHMVAPKLERFLEDRLQTSHLPRRFLDVCCGTGQLAHVFLAKDYIVYGLDLSPHMIAYAIENNKDHVEAGRATFLVADASSFTLVEPVSYATCLFDAINHLPSLAAIASCFRRVYESLVPGGLFIFDINTRKSLQRWNGLSIQEDEEVFILNRGIYEASMDRAYTQITGFVRSQDGRYERFSETVFNLALSVDVVLSAVSDAGFSQVYPASIDNLAVAVPDAEAMNRLFFVCQKG